MELHFKTSNPTNLKNAIISDIENEEYLTWSILEERSGNKYLKHTKQWGDKGIIELTTNNLNKSLIVKVLKYQNSSENVKDFEGYYLGRFCELMFVNYEQKFNLIEKNNQN